MTDTPSIDEDHPSGVMYVRSLLNGGLVTSAEMAIKIAEIIIAYTYRPEDLEQQKPLTAIEQNGKWIVEGSHNKDMKMEGLGPAKVVIVKNDGRVLDCSIMKTGPSFFQK